MPQLEAAGVCRTAVLLSVFLSTPAQAELWSYTDHLGMVHFTSMRPHNNRSRWKRVRGGGKFASPACRRCATDRSSGRFYRYDRHIREAARRFRMPVAFIRAVIKVESDFDPRVVSSVGARGLMQLMPRTGRSMGVTNPFSPRQNILGGTKYLRELSDTFKGNMRLIVAGYHAGPGAVKKYRGIPPYATTRSYVPKVLRNYRRYQRAFP